jgi:hypothetical protein
LNIFIEVEVLTSGAFSSLGIDRSPTVPNQDSEVDVEEFASPRNPRDSWLQQHCVVEHRCAKEELPSPLVNNPGFLCEIAYLNLFRVF